MNPLYYLISILLHVHTQTIEERDRAVQESSKRFSQLREDFKYNLSLLEARDSEIKRLESIGNTLNSNVQTLQTEKTSLMHRLEKLQSREQERKERAKGDAAMQKVGILIDAFPRPHDYSVFCDFDFL
jgi:DNA anti-recombination protein RmuC